ncbi:capsule assembly Wzi family protein [Thalassotalea sp. Y01]|uniref:capsule assembly Wzi family protein n=1 Tax=Thalassotalea sp. Y01 TaxID=2729613 RepID=UPI00145DB1A6|nr:capsule assembly Wzi family protein [Thalassotalea sp. Y01]NMP15141.1 capsule assembly Wzi family protein [Thalassotalea sp. Y01]
MKHSFKTATLAALTGLAFHSSVLAEPWIDTSNIYLRADLQLLADKGHLNIPLTTFPIMWADVGRVFKQIQPEQLDEESKNAYWHIAQHMRRAGRDQHYVEMNFAGNDRRYTSFGEEYRDDNNAQGTLTYMGEQLAARLSVTVVNDPEDDEEARIDDSYIAMFWGNWVFSAGAYSRWWGPGWDTNLALTNNARPMPGLAITRKTSEPFKFPFTEWHIPWTATTFMNQFEDDRHVPNTLLWGFRMTIKPMPNLELGVTRLAQWAGDDRPSDLSTFWDVLKGDDNCVLSAAECEKQGLEPGNQLAGADLRYSNVLFDLPFSIYTQVIGEDGNSKNSGLIGQKVWTHGIDTQFRALDHYWRAYLEYTDSYTDCTPASLGEEDSRYGVGDCLYEHHIYRSGMRYERRVLGNLYENDAETYVLGFISQLNELSSWEVKFRYLDLNYDNSDWYPNNPDLGNTLTKINEEVLMVSVKYQLRKGHFKYTIGGDYSQSSFIEPGVDDSSKPNIYFNVEYNLK